MPRTYASIVPKKRVTLVRLAILVTEPQKIIRDHPEFCVKPPSSASILHQLEALHKTRDGLTNIPVIF